MNINNTKKQNNKGQHFQGPSRRIHGYRNVLKHKKIIIGKQYKTKNRAIIKKQRLLLLPIVTTGKQLQDELHKFQKLWGFRYHDYRNTIEFSDCNRKSLPSGSIINHPSLEKSLLVWPDLVPIWRVCLHLSIHYDPFESLIRIKSQFQSTNVKFSDWHNWMFRWIKIKILAFG